MTHMEEIAKNIIGVTPRLPFTVDNGSKKRQYIIDSEGCWEIKENGENLIADHMLRLLINGDLLPEQEPAI